MKRTTVRDVIHYHRLLARARDAGHSATAEGVEAYCEAVKNKRARQRFIRAIETYCAYWGLSGIALSTYREYAEEYANRHFGN